MLRVTSTLGDLVRDMERIPSKVQSGGSKAVRRSIREGNALARGYARANSGVHGKNYFKRLTAEMTGPLEGEYGPEGDVVENAVGASWRNGPVNTDLEKSQDVIGPRFQKSISGLVDELFWPGAR